MTAGPLLETKFHRPLGHGPLVPRHRLRERFERAAAAPLTLVSAPAGFGKTTVMAQLAEGADDARVAWLSLDASDSDPITFWTYVATAIDRAMPGSGAAAVGVLAAGPASIDAALTTLLNELAARTDDLIVALDDVHVIESTAVHEQLAYVLEHVPSRVHVVIGTRSDPPIPLSRLRARGGLVEIRAADLRFSADEAAGYLAAMGLSLTAEDVAALESRTEGWVAALQLAALSLRGRSDTRQFINAFAGDDRHIVDYLVEEVLRRQSAENREFLLRTSILSRFSAALADAVTGRRDGRSTIEALDRANLFLVPLDDQRRWYRYHHLFGGVLHAYLAGERGDEIPELHRRASAWFEQAGEQGDAIEHALLAGDTDRAADLIELGMSEQRRLRREAALARWIGALPREVVARRPVLAVGYAGSILSLNQWDRVDELLDMAERLLADPNRIVVDTTELESLPAMIELYRGAHAKIRGDLDANIRHARRVLDLVGEGELGRGGAETMIGLAYWELGDLEAGYEWYSKGMASLERAGFIADVVGAGMIGADIRMAEGRLGEAERIYAGGLAVAMRSEPPLRGAVDMHTGLAAIAYERGRFAEADAHLAAGRRLGPELAFPRDPCRSRIIAARLLQARGDLDAALPLLDEAERLYLAEFNPDTRPVAAIRARLLVGHGRHAEARAWAQRAGVAPTDELTYLREYAHLTLARLLVAEAADATAAQLPIALDLLDRLLDAAERGGRDGSKLEILVVQALARQAAHDRDGSMASLDAAVELAAPEGYVRTFLDEGPAMTRLLKAAARRSHAHAYLSELVRAAGTDASGPPPRQGPVDALSERELEVLRLLRGDLDGPELANELVVSLNTLRTHTKNIYAKLGVSSRRAAVRRAEELGLL
ncbi:MAG TPA: LuxR C-terminal-related transcriptional regulator [Candidatus Limnocylindrales bacterium]|nr:LuxR C-terminal-related transcriptional regulator [Candidatus Limnocylindrales bacterium]